MGVIVLRRYIDILILIINFPTPLVLALFLAAASQLLCSFLKCFFGLVSVIFLQYNVTQRTFEIVKKKSRSREYNNYLIGERSKPPLSVELSEFSLYLLLDIRISADASRRPLQLKAAACQTFKVYQENHGDPLHVQIIIIIIILRMRSACAEA